MADFVKKNKKWLIVGGAALLAVIAVVVAILVIGGGGTDPVVTEPSSTTAAHSVTVTDEDGNPLQGVGVYVYVGEELITFARTDADGKIGFTDLTGKAYTAVIEGAPKCYLTQASYPLTGVDTTIALQLGRLEDNMDVQLSLGDTMLDFSVTAVDGTVYTLSELLAQKDAVVLNFWFLGCDPCKTEFPYLQAAYEAYGDQIEVLALNPVNTNASEVAQFQTDNGLTFPMAVCDKGWENVLSLAAYPTTVVIDRNGEICMIHPAYVNETGVFESIFAFFTAENYQQTFVGDLSQIPPVGTEDQDTAENPIEIAGLTEFDVTVEPGQEVVYNIYRASGLIFRLESESAYVIVDGTKHTPVNGVIELVLTAPDNYTPSSVVFGNTGAASEVYHATLNSVAGSYGNPFPLTLGQFTAAIQAGNEQGVYYLYEATAGGTLTVECLEATAGVKYGITLYNLNTYAQRTLEENADGNKVSIEMHAGDTVQVIVSTLPNEENEYPAADLKLEASVQDTGSSTCSHSETELRDQKDATCTTAGHTGNTYCLDCGELISSGKEITATGHTAQLQGQKDATCTTAGHTGNTYCADCGELISSGKEIPATGHKTEVRGQKDATCTTAGHTGNTYCKTCETLISSGKEIPATGHKSETRGKSVATCTAQGYTGDEYCKVCGTKLSTGVVLSKLAHADSNGDKKCDSCGTAMGSTCSHTSTEIRNQKDATCNTAGYTGDTCCKSCGEVVKSGSVIAAYNHNKTAIRDQKSATCSENGYTGDTYCTLCGVKTASGTTIAKTAHTEVIRNQKAATCSAEGYTGDTYCSVCGTLVKTGTSIEKVAHTLETRDKKAATCTAQGYTGDTYCRVCGTLVKSGSVIAKTAHTQEIRNKETATCTAQGYTGDTYCSVCNTLIKTGSTIAKLSHKDNNGDYKCDSCGTSTGSAEITYTFDVGHITGASTEGIVIQLSGTEGTATATVNASGKAVFQIKAGTYTVTVLDAKGYDIAYCPSSVTVSNTYKSNEISFKNAIPAGYEELNGEAVKIVDTGSNSVTLKAGELTYFVFTPSEAGTYAFTANHTIGYYGGTAFVHDATSSTDYNASTNTFTLNIKGVGQTCVIGVTAPAGVTSGTVTITRVGDPVLGWEDKSYTVYSGTHTPAAWTFSGGTLKYIDIYGDTDDYKLVLDSNGYYHLNSVDGPMLYLNLTGGAYADCSLYMMLNSNRPAVQGYVKDENGEIIAKENYNDLVQLYIDNASDGLYRLTPDLVRILKTQNDNWYIWLATQYPNINPDIVWMCNICYVA